MTCGHDRETQVYTMLVNSVLLRGSYDNQCVFATVIPWKLSILDADLPICNLDWNWKRVVGVLGIDAAVSTCLWNHFEMWFLIAFLYLFVPFVFHFFTRDRKQGPGDMHISQARFGPMWHEDFGPIMRRTIYPVYYDLFVVFCVFVPLYSNDALIFMIMLLHITNMKLGIWTHFVKSTGK